MSTHKSLHYLTQASIHAILIFGAFIMLLPFLWMVSTSLKSPTEVLAFPPKFIPQKKLYYLAEDGTSSQVIEVLEETPETLTVRLMGSSVGGMAPQTLPRTSFTERRFLWDNYVKAWNTVDFPRYYLNTIFVALTVMFAVLFTSSIAAYAFARMHFFGRDNLFMLFLSMMMVPMPVYLVPTYLILSWFHWIDTYYALIVPWMAHVFSIFLLRQHFKTIPKDLYDAAVMDGCTHWTFLWKIVMPLSKSVLVTVALFSIIGSWNSFMWPLIVTHRDELRVLQVGLSYFSQENGTKHELLMAASTFCIAPLLVLFFLAQKQIIASFARSGLKD